jgi:hypothetical protein
MGKLETLNNKIFLSLILVLLSNCAMSKKSSSSLPKLTIIIIKSVPEKQSNFRVYDLATNQKFAIILQDSIFQIKQSALKERAILYIDGYFSHCDMPEYYKTGKNDTLYILANFAVFIE